MLIAFVCSITLVPAALALLDPPGEAAPVGFGFLAPLDDFLQRHRIAVIIATIGLTLAGTPLLLHLPFDFNPINLQNPNSPAVVTYRQVQNDPETSASDAELLASSLDQADTTAKRLAALPKVSRAITMSTYVPDDQDKKIQTLKSTAVRLRPVLNSQQQPAPTDKDIVASIKQAASALSAAAGKQTGADGDAARNVAALLDRLASADAGTR